MTAFSALGRAAVRHRWVFIVAALVVAGLAGVFGGGVADKLTNGGYTPDDSPSARADRVLAERFGAGEPDLVLLATTDGALNRPEVTAAGQRLHERIAGDQRVRAVVSYFSTGSPDLRSTDGAQALLLVTLRGDEREIQQATKDLVPRWQDGAAPLRLEATGRAQVNAEIAEQSERDLVKAELIGAPVTLLILVVVFGSLRAAALPVVVGMLSVAVTSLVLTVLSELTDVSIFAMNLTTALGFGLAVDYSLFIVARFREEIHAGLDPSAAIVTSVATAGRTVVVSAVTVALSLSALLIFPLFFLRSLAYAAISVVLVAALSAVTVLPAVLALLGRRAAGRAARAGTADGHHWSAIAHAVMTRPVVYALPVLALLALAALPFTGVRFGAADYRTLPADAPSHRAAAEIRANFDRAIGDSMTLLVPAPAAESTAAQVSTLDGAVAVDGPAGSYRQGQRVAEPGPASASMARGGDAWLRVWPADDPYSPRSERLVHEIRALDGAERVAVAGPSATLVDTKGTIADRLPWAVGLIALTTFVLLFLFSGGVLVPVKALVLNLFSLTASFGAAVYVFQQGHLEWLVGDFTETGYLETTIPVLIFCIAFGLSMDYEVFLLSRIREAYLHTGDNTAAVAHGLRSTGRVFTAAAVVVAFVLAVLATSGVSLLKLLGVTIAIAIVVDAFLVRGILVPAFMKLAGRANWWAPGPLARLHHRWGLAESVPPSPPAAARRQGERV